MFYFSIKHRKLFKNFYIKKRPDSGEEFLSGAGRFLADVDGLSNVVILVGHDDRDIVARFPRHVDDGVGRVGGAVILPARDHGFCSHDLFLDLIRSHAHDWVVDRTDQDADIRSLVIGSRLECVVLSEGPLKRPSSMRVEGHIAC